MPLRAPWSSQQKKKCNADRKALEHPQKYLESHLEFSSGVYARWAPGIDRPGFVGAGGNEQLATELADRKRGSVGINATIRQEAAAAETHGTQKRPPALADGPMKNIADDHCNLLQTEPKQAYDF
jgi:hypothetical protein